MLSKVIDFFDDIYKNCQNFIKTLLLFEYRKVFNKDFYKLFSNIKTIICINLQRSTIFLILEATYFQWFLSLFSLLELDKHSIFRSEFLEKK